jgi:hypothetical protein
MGSVGKALPDLEIIEMEPIEVTEIGGKCEACLYQSLRLDIDVNS